MASFRDLSIQKKLTMVTMSVSLVALLVAVLALLLVEVARESQALGRELRSIAAIIGSSSKAALEFQDKTAARQILSTVSENPDVLKAQIYDEGGEVFAVYRRADINDDKKLLFPPNISFQTQGNLWIASLPITIKEKQIGTIQIIAESRHLLERFLEYLLIACVIMCLSSLAAYILSLRLRDLIAHPILHLSEVTRKVSRTKDYSLRAIKEGNDETGGLIDQFNEMLAQLSQQNDELKHWNEDLEYRVHERTRALELSQEQLRNSERLASIGTLAAGVAHEIRNPLNSILLATQLALKQGNESDQFLTTIISSIDTEAKRCALIIKNVLLFAKSEPTQKTLNNINQVIMHAVDLAKSYVGTPQLKVDLSLSEPLPLVNLNPTEIEQVIVNLVMNASEAAAGQESLLIRISTELTQEEQIRIIVVDNGPGIPEEVIKHVFDPFFSTKRRKGNTGLGLSLSHGIIMDHGGTMTVHSIPTKGATFTILLPVGAYA